MFGQLDYKKTLSYRLLVVLVVAWAGICVWKVFTQDAPIDVVRLLLSGIGIVASFWIAISTETQMWKLVTTTDDYRRGADGRTETATGTVIGGQPSGGVMIGEQTHALPVVEFEVGGETFHAAGPRPRSVQVARDDEAEPAWGESDTLLIPAKDVFGEERSCRAMSAEVVERFYSDDISSKEEWSSWRYGQSVLSRMFPVGSEVTVAYDPDDPQGNCRVLTPDGREPFSGGAFTNQSLASTSCMLALSIGTVLLSFVALM